MDEHSQISRIRPRQVNLKSVAKTGLSSTLQLASNTENLLIGKQGPNGNEGVMRDPLTGDVVFWNRSTGTTMGPAQDYPRGEGISRAFGYCGGRPTALVDPDGLAPGLPRKLPKKFWQNYTTAVFWPVIFFAAK